ncbi:hypothetical protein GUJ93_ZPchr0009g1290 [Zizania palustris]|uniref:Uncharacterized protein n=1 Tax=Zizania palustris TaxID=103762 RepID=A0A8J5RUJ0_ZIZPA|nr:hypothetical protein GUJ93_ZPchr0009g1290 [Zizania palustris]
MQRILSRAARRCTKPYSSFKPTQIVQDNGVSRVHPGGAPTSSNGGYEYEDFKWMTNLASRSIQADIVTALRRGDRQQASLLLSNLRQANRELTSEDFSYILEYCAKAPDPLFATEALRLMEENAVHMSKSAYISVTRALSKGGRISLTPPSHRASPVELAIVRKDQASHRVSRLSLLATAELATVSPQCPHPRQRRCYPALAASLAPSSGSHIPCGGLPRIGTPAANPLQQPSAWLATCGACSMDPTTPVAPSRSP